MKRELSSLADWSVFGRDPSGDALFATVTGPLVAFERFV
jgi:hypothetical protein